MVNGKAMGVQLPVRRERRTKNSQPDARWPQAGKTGGEMLERTVE
jgi:hypothetical protein